MRLLGNGGFAEVYLAEHIHLRYPVAIKFLHANPGNFDDQFADEAKLIAGLQHPHIIRLMDFGIEISPYLVMEYAEGGTLRRMYPRGIAVAPSLAARFVEQIASALQYVHDLRFIHRDIKPDNILLRADGTVALSDFGTAAVMRTMHTHTSQSFEGTLPYSAPEQISGNPSPASDQYSLGVVVYELLSGHLPLQGPDMAAFVYQHLNVQPIPLRDLNHDISSDVEAVVMRALAKDPRSRFARISDFAIGLSQALEETRLLERRVWSYPEIETTVTSFGNQETARPTLCVQEPTLNSAAGTQAIEISSTTEQSSQQIYTQEHENIVGRVLGMTGSILVTILGVLTFLAGLPLGIGVFFLIGNYLDAVEGSEVLPFGTHRSDNIDLLLAVCGFTFAVVYAIYMRIYNSDGFGETKGFAETAYTLCGSTAAAEGAAAILMLSLPPLIGSPPPTPLDWKVLGITFIVFIIEAIGAALAYYLSHRS